MNLKLLTTFGTFTLCLNLLEVKSQALVSRCDHPNLASHAVQTGHSYCYHICYGIDDRNLPDLTVCDATGNCICSYGCDTPEPIRKWDVDTVVTPPWCPPLPTDPPNPLALTPVACSASCAASCTDGEGMICGIGDFAQTYGIYPRVCTCYCPPQVCNPPVITTTTTTSTQATPTTTNTAISIFLVPKFPKITVIKKILKLFKFCILLIKLCALYWTKGLLLSLYFYIFHFRDVWNWLEMPSKEGPGWGLVVNKHAIINNTSV